MSTCHPESQPYPGLHKKKPDQQFKAGDSTPLLCSQEILPGLLHPALVHPVEDRHGPVRASPEEGHENCHRAGTPLLQGKTERVVVAQPGEEKTAVTPYCSLLILKGGL